MLINVNTILPVIVVAIHQMNTIEQNIPSTHMTSKQRRIYVDATSGRRIDVDMTRF